MTARTVTGDIEDIGGGAVANGYFWVVPVDAVRSIDADTVGIMNKTRVTADGNGDFSVDLQEGEYFLVADTTAGALTARFVVDSDGPWTIGRLMGLSGPVAAELAQQVFAAAATAEAAAATSVALQSAIQIRNLSANHTLALTDAGYLLVFDATATLTIQPQSSVAWPAGTVVAAAQTASASLSVAAGAGVTIIAAGSPSFGQGQAGTLIRTAEDEWLLLGDFA